jgi:hypothetical protein
MLSMMPVTLSASAAVSGNPLGTPASRSRTGRAKVARAHVGNSERTSSRLACSAALAVGPPGQYPEITTRCLTRPGWRRAS